MAKLTKIGVLSLAKIYAVMFGLAGLVLGVFSAVASLLLGAAAQSLGAGANLGLIAVIVMPLIYALIGLILGALTALLFNVAAKRMGGLEVDGTE